MPITILTVKKILKDAGAERISDDAAEELAEVVNRFAFGTAKKAVRLAAHAKRKTVKKIDIELAK
jgi:histone H3/H4